MTWKDSLNLPVSAQGEWAAKRFYGDPKLAAAYLPVAYALLGEVKNRMAYGGVSYGHRAIELPDGTRIRVIRNGEQNILEIETVPPVGREEFFGSSSSGLVFEPRVNNARAYPALTPHALMVVTCEEAGKMDFTVSAPAKKEYGNQFAFFGMDVYSWTHSHTGDGATAQYPDTQGRVYKNGGLWVQVGFQIIGLKPIVVSHEDSETMVYLVAVNRRLTSSKSVVEVGAFVEDQGVIEWVGARTFICDCSTPFWPCRFSGSGAASAFLYTYRNAANKQYIGVAETGITVSLKDRLVTVSINLEEVYDIEENLRVPVTYYRTQEYNEELIEDNEQPNHAACTGESRYDTYQNQTYTYTQTADSITEFKYPIALSYTEKGLEFAYSIVKIGITGQLLSTRETTNHSKSRTFYLGPQGGGCKVQYDPSFYLSLKSTKLTGDQEDEDGVLHTLSFLGKEYSIKRSSVKRKLDISTSSITKREGSGDWENDASVQHTVVWEIGTESTQIIFIDIKNQSLFLRSSGERRNFDVQADREYQYFPPSDLYRNIFKTYTFNDFYFGLLDDVELDSQTEVITHSADYTGPSPGISGTYPPFPPQLGVGVSTTETSTTNRSYASLFSVANIFSTTRIACVFDDRVEAACGEKMWAYSYKVGDDLIKTKCTFGEVGQYLPALNAAGEPTGGHLADPTLTTHPIGLF